MEVILTEEHVIEKENNMTQEHLEILRDHCEGSDEDIQEASDAAENAGYGFDGYSNNQSELIAFINGYIYHKNDKL